MKEDLKYADFWEKLEAFIQENHLDPIFDEARKTMEQYRAAYYKARSLLDPETEDELVLYCAASDQFCMAYAFAAYEMGLDEGQKRVGC